MASTLVWEKGAAFTMNTAPFCMLSGILCAQGHIPVCQILTQDDQIHGVDPAITVDIGGSRIDLRAPVRQILAQKMPSVDFVTISIHPPLAGRDAALKLRRSMDGTFQSTHPLRGGTLPQSIQTAQATFQSTHPLRGGTPVRDWWDRPDSFQSTHPLRGGTWSNCMTLIFFAISIHPPLAGWDLLVAKISLVRGDFNPPTPCGVGRSHHRIAPPPRNFNPPTPCGVGLCRA